MSTKGTVTNVAPSVPTNFRAILLATFVAFGEFLVLPAFLSSDAVPSGGFLFGYDIGVISVCQIPFSIRKLFC